MNQMNNEIIFRYCSKIASIKFIPNIINIFIFGMKIMQILIKIYEYSSDKAEFY